MAVYTEITAEQLAAFVADYDIGEVLAYKGIAEGVENSNYLLHAEAGYFILTLYEKRVDPDDLPFFLSLMEHLAARGIPCPTPLRGTAGKVLGSLAGRPAAIVTFLDGMSVRRPSPPLCAALGKEMARMHLAGADFPMTRANSLSVAGWRALFDAVADTAGRVHAGLGDEIARELDYLETHWPDSLPAGVIHADLFPDNVLFLRDRLSGVIDFYFACNDVFAYDLAICLNAWCFEPDIAFNITKARALLAAYCDVRPIDAGEFAALPLLARGAALRFLLTRLNDWLNVPEGALVRPKDPLEYLRRLRFHQTVLDTREYGLDP